MGVNLQWIALPLLRHICQPLQKQLWLLKIENEFSLGSSGNNCNKPGGFVFFYGRNKSILECFKTGGFIRTWKAIVVRRAQGPENIEPRRVLIAGDGLRELSAPNEERILSSMTLGKCPACIISRFKHLTSSRKCAHLFSEWLQLAGLCRPPSCRSRPEAEVYEYFLQPESEGSKKMIHRDSNLASDSLLILFPFPIRDIRRSHRLANLMTS